MEADGAEYYDTCSKAKELEQQLIAVIEASGASEYARWIAIEGLDRFAVNGLINARRGPEWIPEEDHYAITVEHLKDRRIVLWTATHGMPQVFSASGERIGLLRSTREVFLAHSIDTESEPPAPGVCR